MRKKCDLQEAFDKTLSLLLKRTRENRNLSQHTLSFKTGISRNTLVDWEKGIKTPNSYDLYNLIKELYSTQVEFWYTFSEIFEENVRTRFYITKKIEYRLNGPKTKQIIPEE